MTKGEAKQLLDALIGLQENYEKLQYMYKDEGVITGTCLTPKRLHIHSGLKVLADALGVNISLNNRISEEYQYEYSFKYRGYTIFQIEKEEMQEWKN